MKRHSDKKPESAKIVNEVTPLKIEWLGTLVDTANFAILEAANVPPRRKNNLDPEWVRILANLRYLADNIRGWLGNGIIELPHMQVSDKLIIEWGLILAGARNVLDTIQIIDAADTQVNAELNR